MSRTAAYDRFIASMNIGFEEWHDGIPYDLSALAKVTQEELRELETILLARRSDGWRDAEALAAIGSARALEALQANLEGSSQEVRLRSAELLFEQGKLATLGDAIAETLRRGALGDGLASAERLAAEHPSPVVIQALLEGALCSDDGRGVRFAAILYYLHGRAKEPFDWAQRPFFLRFNSGNAADRHGAFSELCVAIGADGSGIACP